MKKVIPSLALCLCVLAFLTPAGAPRVSAAEGPGDVANLTITNVVIGPTSVDLTVLDSGTGSTGYLVQSSDSLEIPYWEQEGGIIGGGGVGAHNITLARADFARRFYRVIGVSATAADSDGDGLSDTFEQSIGTNPSRFDTDGDGYSDGAEYAYGTNPLNASSTPALTKLPRAEFVDSNSSATEGSSPHVVKLVFDKPFHGTLKYVILPESTAAAPADFLPLSGSVVVDGAQAGISIPLMDDLNISPSRVLFLQIVTDPGQPYARGGRHFHAVSLADNDSWWSCLLRDKYAERNLRVKLLHNGSTTQAFFAAGAGQDGLPVLGTEPVNSQSNQSEGVIPIGTWPGTVAFDTPAHFKIATPALTASTGGLFGSGTGLTRTLVLECQPSATGPFSFHSIAPGRYVGTYTEALALPGSGYLTSGNTGTFVLIRDLPARANVLR